MRTIKFRGKRADNGEWAYGDLLTLTNGATIRVSHKELYAVDPETVGQFTGLFDKNGKEIYEGDIIKFRTKRYWDRNGKIDHRATVSRYKWFTSPVLCCEGAFLINESNELTHPLDVDNYDCSLGCMGFKQNNEIDKHNDSRLHIIGNIHDNPELLKTK